jgi:hypothetical protein
MGFTSCLLFVSWPDSFFGSIPRVVAKLVLRVVTGLVPRVMTGLGPVTHDFADANTVVGGRAEPGHDTLTKSRSQNHSHQITP